MLRTPFCAVFLLCLASFVLGCGSNSGGATGGSSGSTSAATPVLTAISPATATVGGAALTLTATGQNFVAGCELTWNGTARATLYQSATTLQMTVNAADLAAAGTAAIAVSDPQTSGGLSSNTIPFMVSASAVPNPVPVLSSVLPASTNVGSAAVAVTLTGNNFLASSVVSWNGQALSSTYTNSTTLVAQIPAANLTTAGSFSLTVTNPAPGGGTSASQAFTVNAAGTGGMTTVAVYANDLVWDAVNQVMYLSLPSTDGSNGNSIQPLNPVTGALGAATFAGSEPDLLAVSATSKYLYASLNGSSSLQRFVLPSLTKDITIPLGSDKYDGSFIAMDLQTSPVADGTIAVVRGTPGYSPEEEGGVLLFDDAVQRPNLLCGWIEYGCSGQGANLFDSIQWSGDGTQMYALNNEDTAFNFYSIPVTASGFGTVKDYGQLDSRFGDMLHYDAVTKLLYTNDGEVINPSAGTRVGTLAASGLVVPDGKLGLIFALVNLNSGYTLEWFDINHYTLVGSMALKNVTGTPNHLIRWGSNGLAFTTVSTTYGSGLTYTGSVYVVSGSF